MSRTARLLELMISLHTRPRFLVQELADEYGVSRRTMLRDLHALSETGVPLAATPGPHGGCSVISGRKLLPLTLTTDEAIGVLLSYEAFLQYAQSPFAAQSLSAITKLRQALPADVVRELDRMRERVAVIEPPKSYEAPHLNALLDAALGEAHLRIKYESVSGVRERAYLPARPVCAAWVLVLCLLQLPQRKKFDAPGRSGAFDGARGGSETAAAYDRA
jgi:predicted DNA-binding transcriptional regulator YafY